MKPIFCILLASLAWSQTSLAKPFETQAQIESRLGGRVCNGAETEEYKVAAYAVGDLITWVLYMAGVSNGEMYIRNGAMPDMEVATFLEANKGQSIWQVERIQGSDKQVTTKAWSRKDGQLYAMWLADSTRSIFMIGTKKAERFMGDMKKLEERLKPRDRIQ